MKQIREQGAGAGRLLERARSAQAEGQTSITIPLQEADLSAADAARDALTRQGHRVRLTREQLEVTFGPQRLQERGLSPG